MRTHIFFAFLFLLQASLVTAQKVEPINKVFSNYSTKWIANDGGWEKTHIPHDMLNLRVNAEGIVATVCEWDEGGSNVAVFKDGKLLSIPEGSGTGGWGRFSLGSIAIDNQYVYQTLVQTGCDGANRELNANSLPQFPPCNEQEEWKVVRRYHLATGLSAPFPKGYGYKGDMLLVAKGKSNNLKSVALSKDELFVCQATTGCPSDTIKVYQKTTLKYLRQFPIAKGCIDMAADTQGKLWLLYPKYVNRAASSNGKIEQAINLSPEIVPSSLNIDAYQQRLLIADHGKHLNIRIYTDIYQTPKYQKSFGIDGGIYAVTSSHIMGQCGPLRFSGPRGVGVDQQGNIYIANTSISGGRGASIECYNEKEQTLKWQLQGLVFTATADFERTSNKEVYTPEKVHAIDYNAKGRADRLLAYTVNPLLFPNDQRCTPNGPFITSCFKRKISNHDLLFVSDMYGGMLAGYRFDNKKYGYIGIPCVYTTNGDPDKNRPITFWTDQNGDGKEQPNENQNVKEVNQYSMSFVIDHNGNIWRGTRQQGFFLWKLKNIQNGIPQYERGQLYTIPEGIDDCKRIWYDAAHDELYLTGFSKAAPDHGDTWWCLGSTITKYSNVMRKLQNGTWNKTKQKPDYCLYIPFHHEDGTDKSYLNAKAFTIEGDYIFVALGRFGYICVYRRSDGRFMGRLQPGPEVKGQSGWCDFNYAINVFKEKNGTYRILHEENAFAKVLLYTISNFTATKPLPAQQ